MSKPIVLKKLMREMDLAFKTFNIPWNYRMDIGEDFPSKVEKSDYWFSQRIGSGSIGQKCIRKTFFNYHQVAKSSFKGQLLRLFNFGHVIEKMTLANLHVCGFNPLEFDPDVLKETGNYKQFSYTAMNNRVVAKPDAKFLNGVVGHEELSLGEIKSSNLKKFMSFKNKGVEKTEYKYWEQMQLCMSLSKIPWDIFIVTCKDNSEVYAELIPYDRDCAKRIATRCKRILHNPTLLPPKSDDYCYNCDFRHVCAGGDPLKRCRTCDSYVWEDNTCEISGDDCGKGDPCNYYHILKMTGKWNTNGICM